MRSETLEYALLRDLLLETKDGEWGSGEGSAESTEMLVVRGTDFDDVRHLDLRSVPSRHILQRHAARKTLRAGDVLIETAGGSKGRPTGRTVFLRDELFHQSGKPITCASFARFLRFDGSKVDSEYVYWWLQSLYQSGVIETYQVQHSGIARFQFTKFANEIRVPLPAWDVQRFVADVLGTLERRVTVIRKTNETLESIVQALFKSWFIDFDPVHANAEGREPEGMDAATAALFPAEFEESAIGLIPKGWACRKLRDLVDLVYGKALKSTDRREGTIPVYGSGGVTGFHNEALVNEGSVIVGRKGTVGSLYWEDGPFYPIDTTFYLRTKNTPLTYCYYAMQRLGLENMNTDAAVPGLNRENAYRLELVRPSDAVLTAFDGFAREVRRSMRSNSDRVKTFENIRDTLLPRLISSKLRLSEVEDQLNEVVA